MKFAYADPPYFGNAKRYYGDHPEAAVYDTIEGHQKLIVRLENEFLDGWAMSCGSKDLKILLPLCPSGIRVGSWVKPFANYKPHVNPGYTWEPVIFRGGRKHERFDRTVRDSVSVSITLKRGCVGAKPEAFCFWIFELLNMRPGDEFIDLFPGSGAAGRAWTKWIFNWTLLLAPPKDKP